MRRVCLVTLVAAALWVFAPTAAAAPRIVAQPGSIVLPVWSPDGKSIAWIDATMDNVPSPPAWQGWEAGSDGSHARMIISGPVLSEGAWQLNWIAPKTLALFGNFNLYLVPLGARPKLLAPNITVEVSSDRGGTRFAYEKSPCGGQCNAASQVIVISRVTGSRSVIGNRSTHYSYPTISPDGSRVAFTSAGGLLVAPVSGHGLRRLTSQRAGCPQWSPDGHNILYNVAGSLRVIDVSGRTSKVLVQHGVGCGFAPFNFGWSPDGKTAGVIEPRALTLIDIATGRATKVPGFSSVTGFAWSPDSSQLLVAARPNADACSSLWRVHPDGSHRRLIVSCGN